MDLKRFCEKDQETSRPWMLQPLSFGDKTYATNGYIIIRVPRRDDVKEDADGGAKCAGLFAKADAPSAFSPAPMIDLPKQDDGDDECPSCEGRRTEHDCPSCECECCMCEGTGRRLPWLGISCGLNGGIFAARYLAMIKNFPGLEFSSVKGLNPIWFRFEGGDGMLMPRREKDSEHIDLNEAVAA